jgi:hypothetical protein
MKTRLANRRAEGYVDIAVSVLILAFLLAFAVNIFSLLVKAQDMEYFARELCDAAASSGRIGQEVEDRYAELCEETGLSPEYSFEAEYFDPADKTVQLGDTITCTVSMSASILGFGDNVFPVTLTGSHSGLSRCYWK